jgi:hypothetical protein
VALRVILVIVACALQAGGQVEQPPTAEQCRAHADLWLAESNVYSGDFGKMRDSLSNLGMHQLILRCIEMNLCTNQYRDLAYFPKFQLIVTVYQSEQYLRQTNFLARHGLQAQFYAEDAAGVR